VTARLPGAPEHRGQPLAREEDFAGMRGVVRERRRGELLVWFEVTRELRRWVARWGGWFEEQPAEEQPAEQLDAAPERSAAPDSEGS
jgi:hypothetical protein